MLKVGRPEFREYWRSGREQSICISNAVKRWIRELFMDGDAGAVAQKDGTPAFRTDVCPGVDVDSVHDFSRARRHWLDRLAAPQLRSNASCAVCSCIHVSPQRVARKATNWLLGPSDPRISFWLFDTT